MAQPTSRSNRPIGIALILLALAAVGTFLVQRSDSASEKAEKATTSADSAATQPQAEARTETKSEEKPADARAGQEAKRQGAEANPGNRREMVVSRIWWNRPKRYESIGLDAELRARMDERLHAYLDSQASQQGQREKFKAFRQALNQREWDLARERIEPLATANTMPLQLQAEMMVDIMEMLSLEQHERLLEDHAGLLAGPWISSRSLAGNRRTR